MDSYTKLKTMIDSKYNEGNVQQTENVISLFDLINMLEEEIEPLRTLKLGNALQNQINADRTVFERIGLLRKKAVVNKRCTGMHTSVGKDFSSISFHFMEKKKDDFTYIDLKKDFENDEIYFSDFCEKDRDFVTKYISEIYGVFAILEEYGTLFPLKEREGRISLSQEFCDGLLKIKIELDTYGRVSYVITPTKDNNPDNVYSREWYNRETISQHVDDMRVKILSSIPVEISSLNEVYRKLVEQSISKRKDSVLAKTFVGMA